MKWLVFLSCFSALLLIFGCLGAFPEPVVPEGEPGPQIDVNKDEVPVDGSDVHTVDSGGDGMDGDEFDMPPPVPSGPECGNAMLEEGEECDSGGCPEGEYCSGCICYSPAEPISCKVNHQYVQAGGANEFVFTTLPTCGDDCSELLGSGYKCDLQTCTCVESEIKYPAPKPVCGNGLAEEGEECDGEDSGECKAGEYCTSACWCKEVDFEKDFSIVEISNLRERYNPYENMEFTLLGIENDGSFASKARGFAVAVQAFDINHSYSYAAGEGEYSTKLGQWEVRMRLPNLTQAFDLRIRLYCAREASACSETYGLGEKYDSNWLIETSYECFDSDWNSTYPENTRGFASGREVETGRFVNITDKCSDENTLLEVYCRNSSDVSYKAVACYYGCYAGECLTSVGEMPDSRQEGDESGYATLPVGYFGDSYSYYISIGVGVPPYKFYTQSSGPNRLPYGLVLGYSDGRIEGHPSEAGKFDFVVTIIDSEGYTMENKYSLTIIE